MANNSVDKLNIEITADASKAKKAISDVTRGMETLRSVVKSMGQGSGGMKEIAKDAETAGKSIEQVAKKSEKVSAAVDTAGKKAGESLKKEADELKFSIDAVRKRIQSEKWIPDDKRAKWLQMANAGTGNAKDPAQTLRIRAQMLSEILDEQKRLSEMSDEEKAAKERVLEQDREKLRLYKEANALMKASLPSTAFPVGGGTYRSGNEWYNVKDYLPGGSRYDEAIARRNAPPEPPTPPVEETTRSAEAMEQVREAGEQLQETLETTGTSASSFREKFGAVASVMRKAAPVALNLLNVVVRVQKFFLNFTIGAFSEGLRQAARLTKVLIGHLANLAKRLISLPFKAMGNHAKSSVGGMSDALKQGTRFVTRYILGFRSLFYLARRLRSAISGAFTNLSQYSEQTNANLSLLSSRLEQAKNSLATAFDPILTIITPILNHFIQLLIGALNAVGQFFATLSGQSTWNKAVFNMKDFAASADKSAASSGKAADAADELKKSLMGFDKINKLDDPNKSSSGSGGGGGAGGSGASGADMFTTEQVSTGISNFAQMVKDAWKDSDFTEVGNLIGEKIGTALSNIPWDKAKKKASQFGKSFATFFNGLLESEITDDKGNKITLGDSIGTAIAETINTGIEFLNTLTSTIHFDSIGKFIADGMNTMTIKVNWKGIATTLSNAANGVFDIAATWSGKFKFSALATAIKNTVVNALDGIKWEKAEEAATNIGAGLADALNVFFTEDMFKSISNTLGNAVNTAITGGYTFIGRIEWEKWGTTIKTGIVNFFDRIKWKEIGVTAENLCTGLGTVVNTIFDTGNTLIGRIEWSKWGETIKNGINNFFDTVKWKDIGVTAQNIATGLANAINTLFEGAYTLLGRIEWKQWGFTVGTAITNFFKTINWGTLGITFNDAVQGLLSGLTSTLETVDFTTLGEGLVTALANINWGELFIKASKLIVVAAEALTEFVAGLLKGLEKALEDWVRENFPAVIADIILGDGVKDANDRPNGVDTTLGWTPDANLNTGGSSGRGMNPTPSGSVEVPATIVATQMIDNIPATKKKIGQVETLVDKLNPTGLSATQKVIPGASAQVTSMSDNVPSAKKNFANGNVFITSMQDKILSAKDIGGGKIRIETMQDGIKVVDKVIDGVTGKVVKVEDAVEVSGKRFDGFTGEILHVVNSIPEAERFIDKMSAKITSSDKGKTIKAKNRQMSNFTAVIKTYKEVAKGIKGKVQSGFTGKIVDYDEAKGVTGKNPSGFTAKVTDYDVPSKTVSGFTAVFNKVEGLKEKIANTFSAFGIKVNGIATGGAFYGSAWHNIPQFAAGGVPGHGTVFVAGERGTEAVGRINGRTEVLNQSQMASVMYDAVLRGMVQAMSVAGNGTVVEVHLDSDARKMFRVVQTEANNYTNATGRPAFNV